MTRNTDKRVEIAAPVEDKEIADKIFEFMMIMLADNVKARELCADGKYRPAAAGEVALDAQEFLLRN